MNRRFSGGGFGVLIYGLFHETFKLSQGAFVLAFLLGMMNQHKQSVGLRCAEARAKFKAQVNMG